MRISIALATLTLCLGSLAACGSSGAKSSSGDKGSSNDSSSSSYCSELKADKAYFTSLGTGTPDASKLDEAFARLHSLAGKAPAAVKDDWVVLDGVITNITNALKDAGISFADIAKMQQGQLPKGADPQKLAKLAPKLQAMSGTQVAKASKAIVQDAKDTCHVTLGSSGSSSSN